MKLAEYQELIEKIEQNRMLDKAEKACALELISSEISERDWIDSLQTTASELAAKARSIAETIRPTAYWELAALNRLHAKGYLTVR